MNDIASNELVTAEAAAKRAANMKHRASIINAAIKALVAGGIDAASAKDAMDLIVAGDVPRVTVQF